MGKKQKRFVILKHTRDAQTHWDFMLEKQDVLRTWRLELPPELLTEKPCKAAKIFDHDIKFLTY